MTRAPAPRLLLHAAVMTCLGAAGCAGHTPTTVDPRRPANASATLDELAQQALSAPLGARPAGFAALTVDGNLVFVDATGQEQHRAASSAAELLVCGDAIGEVSTTALGLRRWPEGTALGSLPRDDGARLVGASVEGQRVAVVEAMGPRHARVSVGVLGAGGPQLTHRLPADGDLGAPLLRGGLLLVPHDGHELLLLDADDGTERARRRSPDDTIRWARMDHGRVYFGGRRAYALRPGMADASTADAVLDPDLALVPAPPFDAQLDPTPVREPSADAGQGGASAEGARPAPVHWARVPLEPSDTPSEDRVYVITHGHVFGFDGAGVFRFVHSLASPPLATLATAAGLTLLHADGRLESLHPDDGSVRLERALPPLRSAQAVPSTGPDTRTEEPRTPPDPGASLLAVLRGHDTRTVPDQVYAAHLLATVQASVAAGLLEVYVDRRTEPPVRDAIAMTLRARASDTDALVQALSGRYDFLAEGGERSPPPLHAIVPALARAERTDAYAALLGHLDEPATPLEALPLVIDQLVRWGGAEALGPLLAFVRRYRADSTFAEDVTALVHAARAVDALGGPSERAELSALLGRDGTHPALNEAVVLAARARASGPRTTPRDTETPRAPDDEQDDTSLPRLATSDSVEAHALEQMSRLSPCLEAAHAQQPTLRSVRVRLVLERGGRVALVSVLPGGELERCIADAAVTMRWPRIGSPRQQVGFTLRLAPEPPASRPRSAPPWWAASAARAPRGVAVQPGLPWWASPDDAPADAPGDPREWWQPEGDDPRDATLDRWWLPTDEAP